MKWISPKLHGILDMLVTVVLFAAPTVLGFGTEATAVSYALGVAYVVIIGITAYPFGLAKILPFTVHGAIELGLSPLLIAMPWIAGFSNDSVGRSFFVIAGIALFGVWATTDYKAADLEYGKHGIGTHGKGRMRTA